MSEWPNPEKPGFPINPKIKRCHWVVHPNDKKVEYSSYDFMSVYWNGNHWCLPMTSRFIPPEEMVDYEYYGPCITPAQQKRIIFNVERAVEKEIKNWDGISSQEDLQSSAKAMSKYITSVAIESYEKEVGIVMKIDFEK
jgi:hypothetical protein